MVLQAETGKGNAITLQETLDLGQPVYLTHLATDKPMYRPGETVHFRSLTLERFSLQPADEDFVLVYELVEPNGNTIPLGQGISRLVQQRNREVGFILGPDNKPVRGIGAGSYAIPLDAVGGEYTLRVKELANRFLPQERKFIVNEYQKPRLHKELEFTRKSYGPGERVIAACKVAHIEGGKPSANIKVEAQVLIDGHSYDAHGNRSNKPIELKTNDRGEVAIQFRLPKNMINGRGTLSVAFHDGVVETLSRPIPIVLKKLSIQFFPEGGDLVAGVPNRVYFQAQTTIGKPAEIKGSVLDKDGQVLANVETFNDPKQPKANHGMGVFRFSPKAGQTYRLRIDEPSGITETYQLPEVKEDGVVLHIPKGVFKNHEPIRAFVRSAKRDRSLLVGAYCRGRLLDHKRTVVKKGEMVEVALESNLDVGGVCRVTVFEEIDDNDHVRLEERAERLVYREPVKRLHLGIQPHKQRYFPGDRVKLSFSATNEHNIAQPAIVMVAVVDKGVLNLADEKTYRTMPTHFLLTTEVRKPEDLEHADFLLADTTSARTALDLLLGTQGWRRFLEQKPSQFFRNNQRQAPDEDTRRLLVLSGLSEEKRRLQEIARQRVESTFAAKWNSLSDKRMVAERRLELARADQERYVAETDALLARAEKEYEEALATLMSYDRIYDKVRSVLPPLAALALLLVAIFCLVRGALRAHETKVMPYFATAVCSIVLCALVISVEWNQRDTNRLDRVAWATPDAKADRAKEFENQIMQQPALGQNEKDDMLALQPQLDAGARLIGGKGEGKGEQPRQEKLKKLQDEAKAGVPPAAPEGAARAADQNARRGLAGFAGRFGNDLRKNRARLADKADAKQAEEIREIQAPGRVMQAERLRREWKEPFYVREYAHVNHSSAGVRQDFTETIYWHPALVMPDGKVEVAFDLSDSVTTFQVLVAGHTTDGRLGAATTAIESRLPLSVEPKTPIEVTATDKIDIPVLLTNNTEQPVTVNLSVHADKLNLLGGRLQRSITLAAEQRQRWTYRFQPAVVEGNATLRLEARSQKVPGDLIERAFRIVPDGFPVVGAKSDILEQVAEHEIVLPDTWIKGTLKYQVAVYPSTLADLQKGLEALLRTPHGCFEQTSTSNYPNLLILDYLNTTDQAKPEITRRALNLLDQGYRKLVSFECRKPTNNDREGYEWFGGTAPPHEALTAYGLMQFRDMARVYDVDGKMVERTVRYLLSRRDGKGGFRRNPKALDTFGRAPEDITNAYIVWALTESSQEDDIELELTKTIENAQRSKDAYLIALAANAAINRGRTKEGISLLNKLKNMQQADGHLDAARTSITGSRGRSLQIETTSLALLGWLKAKRPDLYNVCIQKAVQWISKQRGGYGGFGATQSTILALKALIAYAKANKKTAEEGDLILFVDDKEVARQHFPAGAEEAITLELKDADKHLKPGKNKVRVEITSKSNFPYTSTWSYRTLKPVTSDKAPVKLTTRLNKNRANEGETVQLTATVENLTGKGQGMTVAIIGLPGGLTLPEDMTQLKDMARLRDNGTKPGLISFWEIRGRELVLYWRDLAPDCKGAKKIEVTLDLICRIPGQFRGPASRAYLYYDPDHKYWVDPLAVHIAPADE
ncbi:MAG: hypothetical protein KatS3mg105_4622 [Gemmatales bacterium]|nr:MAG: hypothetical protein KatS3mg105_4622 [Gemmatales bacterium]